MFKFNVNFFPVRINVEVVMQYFIKMENPQKNVFSNLIKSKKYKPDHIIADFIRVLQLGIK
jgi:hypothetical protein